MSRYSRSPPTSPPSRLLARDALGDLTRAKALAKIRAAKTIGSPTTRLLMASLKPHEWSFKAEKGKQKFKSNETNSPAYSHGNLALENASVRRLAARIILITAPMTMEFTSQVEPKIKASVVTALVSINRKAAPIKNKCQFRSPLRTPHSRTGIRERIRIMNSGIR